MGRAACGQALIEGSKDGLRSLALHFSCGGLVFRAAAPLWRQDGYSSPKPVRLFFDVYDDHYHLSHCVGCLPTL